MNAKTSKLYRKFVKTLGLPHAKVRAAYKALKHRHIACNSFDKASLTAGMRNAAVVEQSK